MRVREIDCNAPGIARIGAGRGFFYRDAAGRRIDDPEVVDRIRALAIPPAWSDVWICSDPKGHIQATGIDARGRRQYLYHQHWHDKRSREKFERMLRFARALPALRAQVAHDLALDGMPKARVLACATRLLELGFFRVGGETYAKENGTFGLATLQKQHVKLRRDTVRFDFDAKSGQRRRCEVVDPEVTEVLVTLRRRRAAPDAELLAYRGETGWVDIRSQDINDYLKEHLGTEFSAKDFRTWAGTVLAAVVLASESAVETERDQQRAVAHATAEVAAHLGNTPAVARSAYIDPRVVERFEADRTLRAPEQVETLEELEQQVIRLLRHP